MTAGKNIKVVKSCVKLPVFMIKNPHYRDYVRLCRRRQKADWVTVTKSLENWSRQIFN